MYFFLLIIIPLTYFVSEYLCRKKRNGRELTACIFFGVVIACIYTLIHFFAFGGGDKWIYSQTSLLTYYLLTETGLPVAVCLFAVLVGKDSIRAKTACIYPVLAGFYAVFIPYRVLSENPSPDAFRMILYPLLFAVMLFDIDTAAFVFEKGAEISRRLWLRCIIAVFTVIPVLPLPSLFQTYWFLNQMDTLRYMLLGLFVLLSAGFRSLAMIFLPVPAADGVE